ncbi:MAG: carboxypeptidase regulatory-like domain-containing protein [Acidobacteria bacterium]|nr:carboxypeptidase regulatory-like domain-containing protein [Acidobacteriota bacterium]MBI3426064.1 carboxypeptidase regulatory-like domain-containing protein [Acidobacteriota bacterium]
MCLLLIVSFTQTNFAQQPEIASARTGAITGRVLNDEGAPVAGATVSLGMVTNTPQTGRTATTDAEGNFVFRDLPARSYRLFAAQPGYVTDFDSVNAAFYHIGDNVTVNLVKGSVITGRVLNGVGEPVIAATVSAQRVRDPEGKPSQVSFSSARPAQTDDRGVYRIYGLMPGSYIVVVNSGAGFTTFRASPYDGDSPVYYPAATRDTASEVQVAAGATASGIDIRYRSEPGHIISGKLTGAVESARGSVSVNVTLRQAGSGNVVANGFGDAAGATQTYNLRGVADGDYEITATRFDNENGAAATPRRITVRGGDLTGVDLVLNPLATLAGRVVLEPADPANAEAGKCNPKRPPALEEVTLRLQRDEARPPENLFPGFSASDAAPDEKGDFKLVNLAPGRFRLVPALPTDAWYVKALTTAAAIPASAARRAATPVGSAAAAAPAITAAVGAVTLKAGDRQAGATVTLASGAAALQGQLIGKDNAKSAARLRVHLVPAETASAEDLLRYRESLSRADGAFEFKHLAPGKYWLLARPLADDESSERAPRPAAWDSAERAKLRREAEAAKQEVSLTTCQRAADFKLQFTAPVRVR